MSITTVLLFAANRGRAAFERIAGACLVAVGARLAMTRT